MREIDFSSASRLLHHKCEYRGSAAFSLAYSFPNLLTFPWRPCNRPGFSFQKPHCGLCLFVGKDYPNYLLKGFTIPIGMDMAFLDILRLHGRANGCNSDG